MVNNTTLNSVTLKNAISNSEILNQCNIEAMQCLIVQYYNSTILNSATVTIAITNSATATSIIRKIRTLK